VDPPPIAETLDGDGVLTVALARPERRNAIDPRLRDALAAAEKLGRATVVVDLSGVSFMDSTVCGILLGEATRRRREGGELVLVSNRNRASRVLEVAGIDRVVAVHPTLHAAFKELLIEAVP
jgi:anti-sigma B factor antagonist